MHGFTTQLGSLTFEQSGCERGGAQGKSAPIDAHEVPVTEDVLRRLREAGL